MKSQAPTQTYPSHLPIHLGTNLELTYRFVGNIYWELSERNLHIRSLNRPSMHDLPGRWHPPRLPEYPSGEQ